MKVLTPEAKIQKLEKLVEALGGALQMVSDGLEDEGDRVYLRSTNDKDLISEALEKYTDWRHFGIRA